MQSAHKTDQAIITRYCDGDHFIGAHFDKPNSIAPSTEGKASLITVVKIGEFPETSGFMDTTDPNVQ